MEQHALDPDALVGPAEHVQRADPAAGAGTRVDADPVAVGETQQRKTRVVETDDELTSCARRYRFPARGVEHLRMHVRVQVQGTRCRTRHRQDAGFGEAVHVHAAHAMASLQTGADRIGVRLGPRHGEADRERRFGFEQDVEMARDADEGVRAERLRVLHQGRGVLRPARKHAAAGAYQRLVEEHSGRRHVVAEAVEHDVLGSEAGLAEHACETVDHPRHQRLDDAPR